MFTVKFENYKNDYTKFYEEKSFYGLDALEQYLLAEFDKRDATPKDSPHWRSPVGTLKERDGSPRGWVRINGATTNTYDLWLKKVTYGDTIIFEENHYCSPKFRDFLDTLNKKISVKPIYGDF